MRRRRPGVSLLPAGPLLALATILAVLFAEEFGVARAQGRAEDIRWTTFTTQDGLVADDVYAVWGDERAVWFGTDQGVSRYDGVTWKSFTTAEGLAGNKVQAIWGDGQGTVWLGTSGGLSRFDGQSWRTFTHEDGLPGDNVRGIWGDRQGRVWVVAEPGEKAEGGGIGFYDGVSWHSVGEAAQFERTLVLFGQASLPLFSVTGGSGHFAAARAVAGDVLGNVWIGHGLARGDGSLLSGGISRYDGARWQSFTTQNSGVPDDNVNALWAEPEGGLWVGTSSRGVSYFDGRGWRTFAEKSTEKPVLALWGDGGGRVWAGTLGAGASRYDGQVWRRFTMAEGLASDVVQAIWGDAQGRVWFGTNRGVSLYDPGRWDAFRIGDGLPSNDVRAVWCDGSGGIWIGTAGAGVARYHGGRWQAFTTRDGLPGNWVADITGSGPDDVWVALGGDGVAHFDGYRWRAVPSKEEMGGWHVYRLWSDGRGTIWFATAGGLMSFDGRTLRVVGQRDGMKVNDVTRVVGDRAGNLWVAYRHERIEMPGTKLPGLTLSPGGMGRYDGRQWTYFGPAEGLATRSVEVIWPDEQGRIWAGGMGPLSRFEEGRWRTIQGGVGGVTAIWGDGRGTLWLGGQQQTGDGLETVVARFDGSSWRKFTTTRDGLASGEVTDICGDDQGRIWLAHGNLWGGTGGLSVFDGSRWEVWQTQTGPEVPAVQSLAKDATGRLWLGTRKGPSVLERGRWRSFGLKDGLVSLDAESIWAARSGEVWVAHALSSVHPEKGGVSRFDGTGWSHYSPADGLGGKDVGAVWGDDRGTVWAGGQGPQEKGWVSRYDGSRWQTFPVEGGAVRAIWGDGRGSVWFRMARGVNVYDAQGWQYYPSLRSAVEIHYSEIRQTWGSNPLWTVDPLGQVWVAEDGGAASYDGQPWRSFGVAAGLAGEKVRAVLLDRGGTLWFATDGGLSRTDGRTWRTFRVDNSGLGDDNVHGILGDEGKLLFATNLWYTVYTPSPPQVRLEGLTSLTDGQAFAPTDGLTLDHARRSVRIEFSALAPWTPPRDVSYRYRLEGLDQTWRFLENPSRAETRGRVEYPELPPGTYTFTVAAGNRALDYSGPASLRFTIRSAPPVVELLSARVDEGPPLAVDGGLYLEPPALPGARQVVFSIKASDDVGAAPSLSYRLDREGRRGEERALAGASLSLTLGPGSYVLALLAEDADGNSTELTEHIFVPPSRLEIWLPFILPALAVALGGGAGYGVWRWKRWTSSAAGRAYFAYRRIRRAPSSLLSETSTLLEEHGPAGPEALARLARGRRADVAEVAEALKQIARPETAAEGLTQLLDRLRRSPKESASAVIAWYEALLAALRARTVADVASEASGLEKALRAQEEAGEQGMAAALRALHRVARALMDAQNVPAERRAPFLSDVIPWLEKGTSDAKARLPFADRLAFEHVAARWREIATAYGEELRRSARVQMQLLTRWVRRGDPVVLALEVTNQGQGLARSVRLTLPEGGALLASIPLLAPGQREVVEIGVRPPGGDGQAEGFELTLEATYDDAEAWGKQGILKDRVGWITPRPWQPFGNPYVVGRPPEPDSPIFVGREDVFGFVRSSLLEGRRQNVLALIGQRRMGKTSILEQLPRRLGPEVLCVRLDCAGLGTGASMASLLYEVACTLDEALREAGFSSPQVAEQAFQPSPGLAFERDVLRPALDVLGGRRMLWMLDELEAWVSQVERGRLGPEVFGFLRHLVERYESLSLLVAGSPRLYRVSGMGVSNLLNLAVARRLEVLDEGAGRRLIEEPLRDVLAWDDLAVHRLLRLTAGHPYFLQAACWVLVDHCLAERRSFVGPQDVEGSIEEIWELTEAHLQELWREGQPSERLALATLARLGPEGSAGSPSEVTAHLETAHALRLEAGQVVLALEALVERQVLRRVGEDRYAFLVPLFARWVRESWPIGALA